MKTISTLNDADLEQVYHIETLCHPFPWSKNTLLSNQGERYINKKISVNHQLVGFLICHVVLDEATLFNIAIHPDMQKQGLATALINQLLNELEQKKVHTLWLEVRASNHTAIRLYEHLGFNQITVRANYYPTIQGREDAIIMAYTLSL